MKGNSLQLISMQMDLATMSLRDVPLSKYLGNSVQSHQIREHSTILS